MPRIGGDCTPLHSWLTSRLTIIPAEHGRFIETSTRSCRSAEHWRLTAVIDDREVWFLSILAMPNRWTSQKRPSIECSDGRVQEIPLSGIP
jgi:hypothetical protein